MSIKKRRLSGKPLLVATAATAITIVSCNDKNVVTGNLMPPPEYELCIEVEPETAAVTVDSASIADGECTTVWEGMHTIAATAEGYEDYYTDVTIAEDTTHNILMVEEGADGDSGDSGGSD